jgi:hypothetical protein
LLFLPLLALLDLTSHRSAASQHANRRLNTWVIYPKNSTILPTQQRHYQSGALCFWDEHRDRWRIIFYPGLDRRASVRSAINALSAADKTPRNCLAL